MIAEGTIAARGTATGNFAIATRVAVYTTGASSFSVEVNQASGAGPQKVLVSSHDGLAHEGPCPQGDWIIRNDSDAEISYSIEEV